MKKTIFTVCILLVVALVGLRLAGNKKKINEQNKPADRSMVKVPVTVTRAMEQSVDATFSLPAVVKPLNEANITLNTSGKVRLLDFDLGTRVSRGQVIGALDNSLKQISLESAQLLLDKNKHDYERISDLYQGNAATEVDLNNSKYSYENARSQVAQIKQQISDASMVSPLDGVITHKTIEVGEFANVGVTLATVVDITALKATVMVSEEDVYRLREHLPVTITSHIFPGKEFKGAIRFISPNSDESHNYEVEVTVDNNGGLTMKGGTFVKVTFNLAGGHRALQIPKLALAEGTKNPYVYLAHRNKATVRHIVLGRDLGENIEVLSGIKAGDQVITSGQINLTEKSTIEILNDTNKQ